jgi:hypothetical protein
MSDGSVRRIGRGTADDGHEPKSSQREAGVSTIWVMVAVAIVVAMIALLAMWRRGGPRRDLGSVSSHWISEHRLGSNQDYSRR